MRLERPATRPSKAEDLRAEREHFFSEADGLVEGRMVPHQVEEEDKKAVVAAELLRERRGGVAQLAQELHALTSQLPCVCVVAMTPPAQYCSIGLTFHRYLPTNRQQTEVTT